MVSTANQQCQLFFSLLNRSTHPLHIKSTHSLLLTTGLLHTPTPTTTSFLTNTLIRAYSRSPEPLHSLPLLLHLLRSSAADHHSFPFALSASPLPLSLSLHSLLIKNGLSSSDPFVQTALLRAHSSDPARALLLFDEIPRPDPVHLDVLMNSFLRRNDPARALHHFRRCVPGLILPDPHVLTTALTACSRAGALQHGVWIHEQLPLSRIDGFVGSALINMYAKCGCIDKAVAVFESVSPAMRNTFLWSAMVGGFAMHGLAEDAMDCLSRMERERVRPDGVVALGVLSACAHAGRVKEGMVLLAEMEDRYGIVPQLEHYSCTVDMLCRVGRLDDAVGLIGRMPMRPMAAVWGALLTACRTYGNVEYAELAVRELQRLTAEEAADDEGVYVQLSNIYMKAGRMEDARRVRKMIGSRGVKKTVAYSSVEVDGSVSSFVAGDQVHPMRIEIGRILEILNEDITSRSNLPQEEETFENAGCLE